MSDAPSDLVLELPTPIRVDIADLKDMLQVQGDTLNRILDRIERRDS